MQPSKTRALCVSIHDVAPATWPQCRLLWHALCEVVPDLPLTWLLVPHYHGCAAPRRQRCVNIAGPRLVGDHNGADMVIEAGDDMAESPADDSAVEFSAATGIDGPGRRAGGPSSDVSAAGSDPAMEHVLSQLLDRGHELALHGYTHRDDSEPGAGWRDHFKRQIYTTGEGEFAALGQAEALRRLDLGLDWFAVRGWPVAGFVAPAWLSSPGTRAALRLRPFAYTTTISHFVFLPSERRLWSPSLMYTARQAAGRWLSPHLADAMAVALAHNPLLRLSLHPADARHPALLRHAQDLVARLIKVRQPMTKQQFAMCYRGPTLAPPPGQATANPRAACTEAEDARQRTRQKGDPTKRAAAR